MELVQANSEQDWPVAATILEQCVTRCNRANVPLWTYEQVSVESLKQSYNLEGLFFLVHEGHCVGCVFLSRDDDPFWQDQNTINTLFLHKLAIGSDYHQQGLGHLALGAIKTHAKLLECEWLRCDCHGARLRLRTFYETFGFKLVDRQTLLGFDVARYQLSL